MWVVNELPWYANFLAIKVGEEKFERITVEPFSSINLALAAFFKVVVIIRLLIKRLLFQDLDEPHQLVHSS